MPQGSQNPNQNDLIKLGGFEILEKIGEGGMGTVYRARQSSLDRIVALKILAPHLAADVAYVESFRREAKAAARLQHPNTVAVIDAGEADGRYYYAMEFVEGETLLRWVQRKGRLSEDVVIGIGLCVGSALKNAWDKERLIHRDVKPENIMVDADGNVKLCDLGLAKSFGESTTVSLSGQLFGTPQYMSPEQARAEKGIDFRTDIYSLGLTMYYALTGQVPFDGGTPALVMALQLTEQLADPRQFNPSVSPHICRVLEKMLAKAATERYSSWDAVLQDLELVRTGKPPQLPLIFRGVSSMRRELVEAPGVAEAAVEPQLQPAAEATAIEHVQTPAGRPPRRFRIPFGITGVSFVVLGAIAGIALYLLRPREQPTPVSGKRIAVSQQQPPAGRAPGEPRPEQVFAEFRQSFLGALSRRDYTTALDIAHQAAGNPALAEMKETLGSAAEMAKRLERFWEGFPNDLKRLQGRLTIPSGQRFMILNVKDRTVTFFRPPMEQIVETVDQMDTATVMMLASACYPEKDTEAQFNLAWFNFAEGKIEEANKRLDIVKKNGSDVAAARQLLTVLAAEWMESEATRLIRHLQRLVDEQRWAQAREKIELLKNWFAFTKAVKSAAEALAEMERPIAEAEAEAAKAAEEEKRQREEEAARLAREAQHRQQEQARQQEQEREQTEPQQKEPLASPEANKAFAEFSRAFLEAMARRDYDGAQKLAREAINNPALGVLQPHVVAAGQVAGRLRDFWTAFPTTVSRLAGRNVTLGGITGTLSEVSGDNIVLEQKVGESGVAGVQIPISTLPTAEVVTLAATNAPANEKEFQLTLAWFLFAEGKQAQAEARLDLAQKAGADVGTARELMAFIARGPLGQEADKILARLRRNVADKRWIEVRADLKLLREKYADTHVVQAAARELAEIGRIRGDKTGLVGGKGGRPFEDLPQEEAILIGFEFTAFRHLRSITPIYLSANGKFTGATYGERFSYWFARKVWVEAKKGYAVGGLNVRVGGDAIDGLEVVFMRILPSGRLDPADSYKSQWIGEGDSSNAKPIGTLDGNPIIGIFGRSSGERCDALGLIKCAGQELKFITTPKPPPLKAPAGMVLQTFEGHEHPVRSVAFSPDGKYALSSSDDKTLKLWEIATGKELRTFRGHTDGVWHVVFSPDGRHAASASRDKTVKIWNVAAGAEVRTFSGHTDGVRGVAFSPDGQHVLSASSDRTLRLWSIATGQEVRIFKGHERGVLSAAFSPDGKLVVSGGDGDGSVRIWDTTTARELRVMQGHSGWVSAMFSPEGRYVLSAGSDATMKLWEVATGRELHVFKGHENWQTGVFSPDGRFILSASADSTLKLWNVATAREIRTFKGHLGAVNCVAYSPDGLFGLSGGDDKTVKYWKLWDGASVPPSVIAPK